MKGLIAIIVALLLVLSICPVGSAGSFSTALLGNPPTFPKRAVEVPPEEAVRVLAETLTVDLTNRDASRNFYTTYYENAAQPGIAWTGNVGSCDAGTTAASFKDAVALRINYYRAMAGVPAGITMSPTYCAKDQEAALMMAAQGNLSHDPPDTWACYSADGDEGANNSNLALGSFGWAAINGYVVDAGSGNGAVGHRRWVLYPQTQTMGTGDIPPDGHWSSNALWVFDSHLWDPRPPTRDDFVAWPPPGFVPYPVVPARWSFSYPQADFSGTTVTITRGGSNVPVTPEAYAGGYGENTFVWIFDGMSSSDPWPNPGADETYQVALNNVMAGGQSRNFNYTVTVFDPERDLTCTYTVSPLQAYLPMSGGTRTIQVTAPAGCTWEADSNDDWITVLSGQTGTGNGSVSYEVAANATGADRTGSLTVANRTVSIRQKGVAGSSVVPLLDLLLGTGQ